MNEDKAIEAMKSFLGALDAQEAPASIKTRAMKSAPANRPVWTRTAVWVASACATGALSTIAVTATPSLGSAPTQTYAGWALRAEMRANHIDPADFAPPSNRRSQLRRVKTWPV